MLDYTISATQDSAYNTLQKSSYEHNITYQFSTVIYTLPYSGAMFTQCRKLTCVIINVIKIFNVSTALVISCVNSCQLLVINKYNNSKGKLTISRHCLLTDYGAVLISVSMVLSRQ